MSCRVYLLATILFLGSAASVCPQDKPQTASKKVPDGVYAVHRNGLKEKEILPLKDDEVMVIDHHRYLKKDANEAPRILVVRSAPEVVLDLVGEPKAVKEKEDIVCILLKLKPKAATALERLTRDQLGRQITIVLGGEVVTTHKIRAVIKNGDVQITSCDPGGASYLLDQLQVHQKKK